MLKGEILAAIYSWGCRRAEELKVSEILKQFISSGGEKFSQRSLFVLKNLIPYSDYQFIGQKNQIKDPFHQKIVEAYWLGNDLLEKTEKNRMPYHTFSVLEHFGQIKLNQLPENLKESVENCRISWRRVKKISGQEIVVEYQPLIFGQKIELGAKTLKTIIWDKQTLPELKIGDHVSIHFNTARQILTKQQLNNLKKYTKLSLKIFNTRSC